MRQGAPTFRFSFTSMLLGTAVLSFVVYAIVYPSLWAASLSFSVAVVLLAAALTRAAVSAGIARRYWLAFGLAGCGYLGLMYLPVVDERIGTRLISTVGLAGIEAYFYDEAQDRSNAPNRSVINQRYAALAYYEDSQTPSYRLPRSSRSRYDILPQETWAGRAFHSVVAVICGLVCGWLATLGDP